MITCCWWVTLQEQHVLESANKKETCATLYSWTRLFCTKRAMSHLCKQSTTRSISLGQDNPSQLLSDSAVLAESKHWGLDVLLDDSHHIWQLQAAFCRTQITRLSVTGRTFMTSPPPTATLKCSSIVRMCPATLDYQLWTQNLKSQHLDCVLP